MVSLDGLCRAYLRAMENTQRTREAYEVAQEHESAAGAAYERERLSVCARVMASFSPEYARRFNDLTGEQAVAMVKKAREGE